jgi:flavin-dependent dehydrogenase
LQLVNGSRVVIVGGGPAGSFFALHMKREAEKANLDLEVVLFEARDFTKPGPGGCNKCAGLLSAASLAKLSSSGLELPPEIIQAELDSYILHIGGAELSVSSQSLSRKIISVYRGSGPYPGIQPLPLSFDAWLLEKARNMGVDVRKGRVQSIIKGNLPSVVLARETLEADLVVIANGVNSRSPLDQTWGYRPPAIETMAQKEVYLSNNSLASSVHIFLSPPSGLIFGGVIPKGRYANISLLGKDLPQDSINQFLDRDEMVPLLTEKPPLLCGCYPKVGISTASGYYSDRMVVIGDAAVARLYKDGIGAAFITSEAAAATAVRRGVSRKDFARGYRPVCQKIAVDNLYGHFLFKMWGFTRRSPFLLNTLKQAILSEANLDQNKRTNTRVLWGLFTGDESYRKICSLVFTIPALRTMIFSFYKAWHER